MAPSLAYKADTLYYQDREGMKKKTKQLEAKQLALAEANAAAKEVEKVKKEPKD